ncbi:9743_t:CDS:10 [Funneliformis caledonium]|uniref:9743_t:CDS:1 n=1 Tax=Funneliformis caledonium TaxID=1117310 RepID=A0A9N9FEE3_9GLOM|nr:9743_t:CDS:10 [Funneliformis caledonium]
MDKFDFFGAIPSDLPIPVIPGITSSKKLPTIQTSQPQTLPPDLLIRILGYLPITSLPNFARACRRFKVLVYDDELWEQHLKVLGIWKDYGNGDIMNAPVEPLYVNAKHTVRGKADMMLNDCSEFDPIATPPASPTTPNHTGNLLDFAIKTARSHKTLSLIPGLPSDPFSQKSRAASTGAARTAFKKIYRELLPYYLDFRHRRKDSRLFKEYNDPADQAKMLARLINFGKINITLDSEQINGALETTIEYFENSALHHFELAYNVNNTTEMQKWAAILLNLNGGSACIQVFIQKNSIFFDYLYNPLDNFTYGSTSHLSELSYASMKEFFNYVEEEIKKQAILINQVFPQDADVFYTFVERVVEDVIIEYISKLLEKARNKDISLYLKTTVAAHQRCIKVIKVLWQEAKPGLTKIRAEDLMYQMFEPFMDNYLTEELNYVRAQSEEIIEKLNQKLLNKSIEAQQAILHNANREIYKRNYLTSFRKIFKLSTTRSRHSSQTQSSTSSTPRNKRASVASNASNPPLSPTDLQEALWNAKLDKMQQMLSLETALQMVHVNKDSLRRVSAFVGYPDKMGFRIKETLESVFVILLQTLGPLHIKPGFDTAIKHLGEFKSDPESTSSDVAPLVEFFELVHIADLIQQMVQVYYDEELNKYVDKTDFLNHCNKEKKIFEKVLDESVAAGLNKGIQELGNIYIISNARDIGLFVRESERFNGVLRAEDVYEFCQKREDWMIIKKEVDKELYGLKAEDCTIT